MAMLEAFIMICCWRVVSKCKSFSIYINNNNNNNTDDDDDDDVDDDLPKSYLALTGKDTTMSAKSLGTLAMIYGICEL